ncbi:MAG: hypothetical protein Q8J63_10760 [Candidatus Aquicultor sp.]|nr:hypothetical protein [Candidatus Aquicultor sp.]
MRKSRKAVMVLCIVCGVFAGGYIISNSMMKSADAVNTEPPTHRIHTLEDVLKDPILANAMHTNDNYRTLYGTVKLKSVKGDEFAEVWIEQGKSAKYKVHYILDINDADAVIESTNRGDKVKTINRKLASEEITDAIPEMKKPAKLQPNTIYPNWNGTFTGSIVDSLIHPENSIQSLFLRSKITNNGTDTILGRKVTKYTIEPQYKKPMVDTGKYEYYFDNETGILLKTTAYDGNNIKEDLHFETLELNCEIDDKMFRF